MHDGLPVGRDVLAHCQVSQTAVPHPAAIRDADNTPQGSSAGVGYWRYISRPLAYIRAVFERIARFSRLDSAVLPAGEHYISRDSQRV